VTKPELGTKQICAGCGRKFYDLHKTPIVCPTCQAVFVPPKPPASRKWREDPQPAPVAVVPEEKAETDEDAGGVPVLLDDMDEDEDAHPKPAEEGH
jgi:uncharacterized protein (TIGR02300 family)